MKMEKHSSRICPPSTRYLSMISASDRSCLFAMYNIPLKHLRLEHHGMGKMQCVGCSIRCLRCISQTVLFSPVVMNPFNILLPSKISGQPPSCVLMSKMAMPQLSRGSRYYRTTTILLIFTLHSTKYESNIAPRCTEPLPLPFHVDQRTDRQLTSFLYSEGAQGLAGIAVSHSYLPSAVYFVRCCQLFALLLFLGWFTRGFRHV